jgi:hypothetical protein
MRVVSLIDFTPTPRYDGKKWTSARIEESASSAGPWTVLETQAILPLDADPKAPEPRSFTTELATLVDGWYRVTFLDATGDEELPTEPIHFLPLPEFAPSVREVASLIMSRTKDTSGNELGTFTMDTRPTSSKVQEIIGQASSDVEMLIDDDIPPGAWGPVGQAIALRAAMIIERSYFSEQVNTNRSNYPQLERDYLGLMGKDGEAGVIARVVEREAQEAITGEAPLTNRPSYSFPDPGPVTMDRLL